MSLFGDLDVASASDDLFGVPDDTYQAIITKVEVKPSASKKDEHGEPKVGMYVTYQVVSEDEYNGRTVQAYQTIPRPQGDATAEETKGLGYLKLFLKNHGIPESRMNSVGKEDLEGLEVYITTKKNAEGYTGITRTATKESVESGDVSFK